MTWGLKVEAQCMVLTKIFSNWIMLILDQNLKRLVENHPAATGVEFSGEKIRNFKSIPSSEVPREKAALQTRYQ